MCHTGAPSGAAPVTGRMLVCGSTLMGTMLMANLAHGFLMATVIQWGKFLKPIEGAKSAAVIAFLTEIYWQYILINLKKNYEAIE